MSNFRVSAATLEELSKIGIRDSDIAKLLKSRTESKMRELGISVIIPLKEPFDVFMSNFQRRNRQGQKTSTLSVSTYEQILRMFYRFCIQLQTKQGTEVGVLDTSSLGKYATEFIAHINRTKDFKPATYRKYIAVIRSFILGISDYYSISPSRLPRIPQSFKPLPQALPDYEVPNLLKGAKASRYGIRSHFMISMFIGLGLRRKEFLDLRVGDLDLELSRVSVHGKGGKDRLIFIPDPLMPVIVNYLTKCELSSNDYVYPSLYNRKEPTTVQALDKHALYLFRKLPTYIKGDSIRGYHLHSLRHTYATSLLCEGVDLSTIREALGHAHVSTTEIYTKLDTERLRIKLQPALDKLSSWWEV